MPVPATGVAAWPLWRTLAIVLAGWVALCWPWLSGSVVIPWDAQAHFLPQLQFLADCIRRGEWPFWNPYVFAGHPQIADPQSLIFSPPFLLMAALNPSPGPRALDAVVLASLLMGACGIIALFRDRDWHPAGAVLAALVFVFGASASWRVQHVGQVMSIAWLPVAWWLLDRALERRSTAFGLAAGIVAGFMVLGRDQVAFLGVLFLIAVTIRHWVVAGRHGVWRSLAPLAAGLAGGLAVAAIPIVMTILLQGDSNRVAIDLEGAGKGSLHPASLITAAVPRLFGTAGPLEQFWGPPSPTWGPVDLYLARNMGHVYVGALPLVLILGLAWRRGAMTGAVIRFVAAASVAVLLYALGRYTPFFEFAFSLVPGVSLYRRPADATFLLGPLAGIVAGYLLHRALGTGFDRRAALAAAAGLGACLAIALAIAGAKGRTGYAAWPLVEAAAWGLAALAVLAVAVRVERRAGALAVAALIGLFVTADLARNNGPSESTALPLQTYDVLRPDTADPTIAYLRGRVAETAAGGRRDRVELAGIDFHWPNASMVHRLDNTLGYNPVRLAWYSQATGAGDHVALPDQRTFSPLMPAYRSLLADMLGLRFIATGVPIAEIDRHAEPSALPLVLRTDKAFIYENPAALPRVLFVPSATQTDFAAILATGRWPDGFDPRRTVLVEGKPGPSGAEGTARILRYGTTEVLVEARSTAGGYVVLADAWHPWWRAEIDGREVPLLRANVIFRAVEVPPGAARVRFVFRPLEGMVAELRSKLAR